MAATNDIPTAGGGRPSEFTTLESLEVRTGDGVTFTLRMLAQNAPTAPVVLILPAMAVKAKFYLPLARALHARGLSVVTSDLRAQGESTPPLSEKSRFGYRELVEVDLPAVTGAVRERFPLAPLYLFGHSLGGQLSLLYSATAPGGVAGIGVLGTGTVYWRAFGRRWFEALWKIQTIGLISRLRGHWPGGMLIGGAMSGPLMVDWARHSRTGRYEPRGAGHDYERLLRDLRLPILVISLEEDLLGPRNTVDALCRKFPAADVTRLHLDRSSGVEHLDHFEWVKDSEVVGAAVASWITGGTGG